jgi:translation initiation factor IF-2
MAEKEGVDLRLYEIIYRMTEDIEKALKGMLEPKLVEKTLGRAQVLQVFTASKFGRVAGCKVYRRRTQTRCEGTPHRGADIVYEGDLSSLRHEKDDVKEIRQGFECGVGFKSFKTFNPAIC